MNARRAPVHDHFFTLRTPTMATKKPKGLGMGLEALLGPKVQDAAPDTPLDASLPTTLLQSPCAPALPQRPCSPHTLHIC